MTPHKIGRYEIKTRIGRGGMATVFRAYDPLFRRDVAVKLLPRDFLEDAGFRARFEREAQTIASLEHSAIVPVYDFGEQDGQLFLVMRYLTGGSLKDRLKLGALPLTEIIRIFNRLAPALDEVHGRGIIHRDLKPDNVLFDQRHDPFITDFGIVKVTSGVTLTGGNVMMGTPAYMSPEQVRGKTDLDRRSDVYAMGVILFQMLTGRQPYQAETPVGLAMKHVTAPIPNPLELKADLPPACQVVVQRAIAKEPDDRYQTIGQLAEAVARLSQYAAPVSLSGETITSGANRFEMVTPAPPQIPATGPIEPQKSFPAGWPAWGWAIGGLVLVMVLVGLLFVGSWAFSQVATNATRLPATETAILALLATPPSQAVPNTPTPSPTPALPTPTPLPTPSATPAPLAVEFSQQAILPRQGRGTINQIALSPNGETLAVASSLGVWLYNLNDFTRIKSLATTTGSMSSAAWSPDGTLLASGGDNGDISVWDVSTGELRNTLSSHIDEITGLVWSPNGTALASSSRDNTVKIWQLAGDQKSLTLTGHTSIVWAVAWSPDGSQLASGSNDRTVRLWDAGSGSEVGLLAGHTADVFAVAWSPDGTLLASGGGSGDATVRVWDVATKTEQRGLSGHTDSISAVAWSPDGRRLASGGFDSTIYIWDAASGESFNQMVGHTSIVKSVVWAGPDGGRLISGGLDGTLRMWDAANGTELRALADHSGVMWRVAWSPDGSRIASGGSDNAVRIWDAASGDELQVLSGHTGLVWSVAWSPDGTALASGSQDNTIQVWDSTTWQRRQVLSGHAAPVAKVAWSPTDGKILASASFDSTVRVWDTASGESLHSLDGHGGDVSSVAWSPDGAMLASGSFDRTVRLWDAVSGRELAAQSGHTSSVFSVAWSPDGTMLASAGNDGTVRVWEISAE